MQRTAPHTVSAAPTISFDPKRSNRWKTVFSRLSVPFIPLAILFTPTLIFFLYELMFRDPSPLRVLRSLSVLLSGPLSGLLLIEWQDTGFGNQAKFVSVIFLSIVSLFVNVIKPHVFTKVIGTLASLWWWFCGLVIFGTFVLGI